MKQTRGLVVFGLIEIAIGSITFIALISNLILGKTAKPPEVFIFVLTSAVVSSSLGVGILRNNLSSYRLLLFFSTVIILSKLLIFTRLIALTGDLETSIPQAAKNVVSVIYHSLLIWYFIQPSVKKKFLPSQND